MATTIAPASPPATPARGSFLRRALFQVHLWIGLAIGLYAVVIGITGSILVFHEDVTEATIAQWEHITPPANPAATPVQPVDAWIAAVRSATGFKGTVTVDMPRQVLDAARVNFYTPQGAHFVFVNPHTNQVLADYTPKGTAIMWIHQLHNNFFIGRTGRLINGIGAIGLVILGLTGIYLWWPGIRTWRRRLWIDARASWKRINWDVHHAVGFWLMIPVLVVSITGAFFTWPQVFRSTVGSMFPLTPPGPVRVTLPEGASAAQRLPLATLIEAGDTATPGKPVWRVQVPGAAAVREPVRVMKRGEGDPPHRTTITAHVDPYTGKVVKVEGWHTRTSGDRVMAWIGPLHTGNFGGMPVKLLYAVIGLAFPALFVTGFVMWWLRVVRRRLVTFD